MNQAMALVFSLSCLLSFMPLLTLRSVLVSAELRTSLPGSLERASMSAESRLRSNWLISMAAMRLWVRRRYFAAVGVDIGVKQQFEEHVAEEGRRVLADGFQP